MSSVISYSVQSKNGNTYEVIKIDFDLCPALNATSFIVLNFASTIPLIPSKTGNGGTPPGFNPNS